MHFRLDDYKQIQAIQDSPSLPSRLATGSEALRNANLRHTASPDAEIAGVVDDGNLDPPMVSDDEHSDDEQSDNESDNDDDPDDDSNNDDDSQPDFGNDGGSIASDEQSADEEDDDNEEQQKNLNELYEIIKKRLDYNGEYSDPDIKINIGKNKKFKIIFVAALARVYYVTKRSAP